MPTGPASFCIAACRTTPRWRRAPPPTRSGTGGHWRLGCGFASAARLAARQALAAPAVPEPVQAQADAIVARLGRDDGDLLVVLASEPEPGRAAVAREELARTAEAGEEERAAEEVGDPGPWR